MVIIENLLVKSSVCCSAQARVENPVFDTNFVWGFLPSLSLMSSFDQFMWCLSWISTSWFDKKRKEEKRLQDDGIFYYLLFVICYLLFFTFWKFPIKIFSPEKERGEKGTWGCQKGHSEVHSRGRLGKILFLGIYKTISFIKLSDQWRKYWQYWWY